MSIADIMNMSTDALVRAYRQAVMQFAMSRSPDQTETQQVLVVQLEIEIKERLNKARK